MQIVACLGRVEGMANRSKSVHGQEMACGLSLLKSSSGQL